MSYSWYKDGRFYVKSDDIEREEIFGVTKEYFDDYIGNQTIYKRNLDLHNTGITSLGKLERVKGWLELSGTNLTSLGNLKSVGRGLYLENTNLISLGNLERVRGVIRCDDNGATYELLMNSRFKDKVI